MKNTSLSLCFGLIILVFIPFADAVEFKTEEGNGAFIDLNESSLKVTGIEIVDKIVGSRNKTVTASRKNACLLELKIEGTASAEGQFGLYPSGFSVYAVYRRVNKIFPSIAVGVKHRNPAGEMEEYWLNEPEASMMVGCKPGDSIRFYVLFEVPEDTKTFYFQSPRITQGITIQ
ncbi:hypothetical protein JW979_00310 [bacterium]|nr:hypothetical protein [candidate division CSSED10-310 bacterium]